MDKSSSSSLLSPIFLLGFMASGKSTVGRALAEKLNVPFIDLDEKIIQRAGKTIAEIILQDGEPYFRQLEAECLQKAAAQGLAVIALGGGAFMQSVNRELIAQTGVSIWLNAPFELCWERIQKDAVVRPLAPTAEETRHRYQQRIPVYQQAQIQIEITQASSPESLVNKILTYLQTA